MSSRVRHVSRPDLGVGQIRRVLKPGVAEVVWEKRTDTGRRVWGHYFEANLVPVEGTVIVTVEEAAE